MITKVMAVRCTAQYICVFSYILLPPTGFAGCTVSYGLSIAQETISLIFNEIRGSYGKIDNNKARWQRSRL